MKKKSAARPARRQTAAERLAEIEGISLWLGIQRFELEFCSRIANRMCPGDEVPTVSSDLLSISLTLAMADKEKENWKCYRHHFDSDRNRSAFFSKLREQTRRVATLRLAGGFRRLVWGPCSDVFEWDESIMPREAAPRLVRLATLHPGVLEEFLPRFFVKISQSSAKKSTWWRAQLICYFAPTYGWSAEKHTRKLIEVGAIRPSEYGSEVQMVKKFIRDLRARYRRHMEKAQAYSRHTGSSQGDIIRRKIV